MTGAVRLCSSFFCLPRNTMNHTAELEKALTDLRHITGISMEIHAETEEEVTKALEQLKLLSSAYKEKYNKIHFLQSLMTDSILHIMYMTGLPVFTLLGRAAYPLSSGDFSQPGRRYFRDFKESLSIPVRSISNSADRSFLCHSLSCQISGRFFTGNCTSYCPHDRGYRKRGSSGTCPCFVQQDSA